MIKRSFILCSMLLLVLLFLLSCVQKEALSNQELFNVTEPAITSGKCPIINVESCTEDVDGIISVGKAGQLSSLADNCKTKIL